MRYYRPTIPFTVEEALARAESIVGRSGSSGPIIRPVDFPGHTVRVDWDGARYLVSYHQCPDLEPAPCSDLAEALQKVEEYYARGIPGTGVVVDTAPEEGPLPAPYSPHLTTFPGHTWKHATAIRAVRLGHVLRLLEAPDEDTYHGWILGNREPPDPQAGGRVYARPNRTAP